MVELKAITEDNFIDAFNLKLASGTHGDGPFVLAKTVKNGTILSVIAMWRKEL